eukprot:TRINITY_DN5501_c0_g2_i2.p1 TRINITY_DN5501_c0_g2~~TRINITY_DN5501_c0_g2_i2.p1  ORF type:complete len:151 (+),score=13.77 TRINITY_DN5501_c0_g2_i2:47-454(+)
MEEDERGVAGKAESRRRTAQAGVKGSNKQADHSSVEGSQREKTGQGGRAAAGRKVCRSLEDDEKDSEVGSKSQPRATKNGSKSSTSRAVQKPSSKLSRNLEDDDGGRPNKQPPQKAKAGNDRKSSGFLGRVWANK